MPVTQDEVVVGIVAQLDTTRLRALGGCQTNAVLSTDGDRAVVGAHDFLVVGVDAASGVCTAVPLFSRTAVGNQPLVNGKKSGGDDAWTSADTFFSHWQHWRIPVTSVVAASDADSATALTRRRYGAQDRTALDEIRGWEKRNRAPYRAV